MKNDELTEKIYDFIVGFNTTHERTPSLREIAVYGLNCPPERIDKGARAIAQYHVNKLIKEGRLKRKLINKLVIL